MADEYENLIMTDEFLDSLRRLVPSPTRDDITGLLAALDDLDSHPTRLDHGTRLHLLDRELTGSWSLTPLEPADQRLRVLVRPERTALGRGVWRIGPVTWHYRR